MIDDSSRDFFAANLFSHVATIERYSERIRIALQIDVYPARQRSHRHIVAGADARFHHRQRHRAIHRARIDIEQVQRARQHSAQR